MPMTLPVRGLKIRACVSPPQDSVSHIVQVAAIIAAAASTAFPPLWKIIAPAVAPSGFPVIANQRRAWSGGLFVAAAQSAAAAATATATRAPRPTRPLRVSVIRASSVALGFRPQAFASRTAAERVQNRGRAPIRSSMLANDTAFQARSESQGTWRPARSGIRSDSEAIQSSLRAAKSCTR